MVCRISSNKLFTGTGVGAELANSNETRVNGLITEKKDEGNKAALMFVSEFSCHPK